MHFGKKKCKIIEQLLSVDISIYSIYILVAHEQFNKRYWYINKVLLDNCCLKPARSFLDILMTSDHPAFRAHFHLLYKAQVSGFYMKDLCSRWRNEIFFHTLATTAASSHCLSHALQKKWPVGAYLPPWDTCHCLFPCSVYTVLLHTMLLLTWDSMHFQHIGTVKLCSTTFL